MSWNTGTLSNALDALKTFYSKKGVAQAAYEEDQLYLLNPKRSGIKHVPTNGLKHFAPVKYARNEAGSSFDFATAGTNSDSSRYHMWEVSRVTQYHRDYITTDFIYSATGANDGSFFNAATEVISDAKKALLLSMEKQLFRDTTAALGTVASATTTTITLTDVRDAKNFEVGMWLSDQSGNDTTAGITGINRQTGVIIIDNDPAIFSAGDTVHMQNSHTGGMTGLATALPVTRSGATTVHGVDISADFDRLGGTYVNGAGSDVYSAVLEAVMECKANGGNPKEVVMSYKRLHELQAAAQEQRLFQSQDAQVGFGKIVILAGDNTPVSVTASPFCPNTRVYGLNPDSIQIVYWGADVIDFANKDGSILHMSESADQYEVRLIASCNMLIQNPMQNFVLALS